MQLQYNMEIEYGQLHRFLLLQANRIYQYKCVLVGRAASLCNKYSSQFSLAF